MGSYSEYHVGIHRWYNYLQVMQDPVRRLISWFNNVIITNVISYVPWVCMLILTHMKAAGAEVSAPN